MSAVLPPLPRGVGRRIKEPSCCFRLCGLPNFQVLYKWWSDFYHRTFLKKIACGWEFLFIFISLVTVTECASDTYIYIYAYVNTQESQLASLNTRIIFLGIINLTNLIREIRVEIEVLFTVSLGGLWSNRGYLQKSKKTGNHF